MNSNHLSFFLFFLAGIFFTPDLLAQLDVNCGVLNQRNDNSIYKLITIENDTIIGTNLKRGAFGIHGVLKLKDDKGTFQEYKTNHIKAYIQNDKKVFVKKASQRITTNSSITYMQIIEKGKVNLYKHTYSKNTARSIGLNGMMNGISCNRHTDYYVQKEGEKLVLVKSTKFKKRMSGYFGDNPKLKEAILNQKLESKDISTIVSLYNKDIRP